VPIMAEQCRLWRSGADSGGTVTIRILSIVLFKIKKHDDG
jgi:hypothetical protein